MTNIEEYIREKGGVLSGELAAFIAENREIDIIAARKRVERLQSPVHKLKGVFSDNQSFVYHSSQYQSQKYFESLKEALKKGAKRCYSIVTAIDFHYGIILKSELANYSFSPIEKIRGHVLFATLVEVLIKFDIIREYDELHYCLNPFVSKFSEINHRHFKAKQFEKDFLLNQFADWSKNIGICSYKAGVKDHAVGGFQFSFTAPSYISGFVTYSFNNPKPGFLVSDLMVAHGKSLSITDIDFFLQKISIIRASNKTLRLLPVLILDRTDLESLNKLKKNGVLVASISEIFGESYNELLKSLINTIVNAGTILKSRPEQFIQLMEQMTKLVNGKTNNLRGDLFELAVGYYYGRHCQNLDIGKKIKTDNNTKTREIDVFASFENEIRVVECKGYNYPIDKDYIEKYLGDKVPAVRKWLENTFPNKKQIFEIWSTGGFDEEATIILQNAKSKTSRYSIDFLGKNEIINRAKSLNSSKFSEILKDYYLKEIV